MAMTVHCDIVSAEAEIFSGLVEMVIAHGNLGDIGIAPGHAPLTTQLYFKGDPRLDHDVCGAACNSDDPHRIVGLAKGPGGLSGRFDVVMKGGTG